MGRGTCGVRFILDGQSFDDGFAGGIQANQLHLNTLLAGFDDDFI